MIGQESHRVVQNPVHLTSFRLCPLLLVVHRQSLGEARSTKIGSFIILFVGSQIPGEMIHSKASPNLNSLLYIR